MSKGGLFLTTLSALVVTVCPVPRHFHRPIVKNGCLIELGPLTSASQPIDQYFDSKILILLLGLLIIKRVLIGSEPVIT